jgi:hypothetical protein
MTPLDATNEPRDRTRSVSAEEFYAGVLAHLADSAIPFMVGGAFALVHYVGIERETKDLDVFVLPRDVRAVLRAFRARGYRADLTFPHWLAKVSDGRHLLDVIFSSGNGVARVDDCWFQHAPEQTVLGVRARLCPPEEMIWSKAFVQERERFDGADIIHLFSSVGPALQWPRLLDRFAEHWRVLFGHIVTFGFVYPDQRDRIPAWVTDELIRRFLADRAVPDSRVCNGTLLSRAQYLSDIENGYEDPRLEPLGSMSPAELRRWSADVARDK